MAVSFEFYDGGQPFDVNDEYKSYMCDRFLDIVRIPMSSESCPVHGSDSHAVIHVDLEKHLSEWVITSSCCGRFRDEIELAMPFPWTKTPHHLQP
jgi:hypothetical protein